MNAIKCLDSPNRFYYGRGKYRRHSPRRLYKWDSGQDRRYISDSGNSGHSGGHSF